MTILMRMMFVGNFDGTREFSKLDLVIGDGVGFSGRKKMMGAMAYGAIYHGNNNVSEKLSKSTCFLK